MLYLRGSGLGESVVTAGSVPSAAALRSRNTPGSDNRRAGVIHQAFIQCGTFGTPRDLRRRQAGQQTPRLQVLQAWPVLTGPWSAVCCPTGFSARPGDGHGRYPESIIPGNGFDISGSRPAADSTPSNGYKQQFPHSDIKAQKQSAWDSLTHYLREVSTFRGTAPDWVPLLPWCIRLRAPETSSPPP